MAVSMERWSFERPPGLRARQPYGTLVPTLGDEDPTPSSSIPSLKGNHLRTQTSPGHTTPPQHSPTGSGSTSPLHLLRRNLYQHLSTGCDSCKTFHQTACDQSPVGSGHTEISDQCKRAVQFSSSGCDSCKTFYQIQSALALVQYIPPGSFYETSLQLDTLVQRSPTGLPTPLMPVLESPTTTRCDACKIIHQLQGSTVGHAEIPCGFKQLEESLGQQSPIGRTSEHLEEFRWKSPWIFTCTLTRVMTILSPIRKRIELLSISVFIASVCLKLLKWQPICI